MNIDHKDGRVAALEIIVTQLMAMQAINHAEPNELIGRLQASFVQSLQSVPDDLVEAATDIGDRVYPNALALQSTMRRLDS